ncbi:hypothetical protein [Methanosarcina acetivorans]|nr:hypothetical protein [Methanosarcina acetivorans]
MKENAGKKRKTESKKTGFENVRVARRKSENPIYWLFEVLKVL